MKKDNRSFSLSLFIHENVSDSYFLLKFKVKVKDSRSEWRRWTWKGVSPSLRWKNKVREESEIRRGV
jgi:hypothetical protein